jgi:hypothetical protein
MDLALGRARLERVAARALDVGGVVFGMDAGFHWNLCGMVSDPGEAPSAPPLNAHRKIASPKYTRLTG